MQLLPDPPPDRTNAFSKDIAVRVRIAQEEIRSRIFQTLRRIDVTTLVEFSAAERAVIADRGLEDYIVLERFPDDRTANRLDPEELERWAPGFHLRVRHLLGPDPDRFSLDTPADAKAYQARLTEALQALKNFIDANVRVEKPARFEF